MPNEPQKRHRARSRGRKHRACAVFEEMVLFAKLLHSAIIVAAIVAVLSSVCALVCSATAIAYLTLL